MKKNPVFENRWVKLYEKENYMVYDTLDLVAILPVLPNGNFVLINQYRIPVGKYLTELVTGGIEPSENPDTAAIREVLEETGYNTKSIESVGSYYSAPGYISQQAHVFVAHLSDFTGNALESHEEVFNLQSIVVPQQEMEQLIAKGSTHPYLTIAYQHYKRSNA